MPKGYSPEMSVFNRYLAQVTGAFKESKIGRPAKKEATKETMTAAQYMRRKAGRKGNLRTRFLETLPLLMKREGWSLKDLRAAGVPNRDLNEANVIPRRKRRSNVGA